MHCQIGSAIEQRNFKLFREEALATDFAQRPIEDLIAGGGHAKQLHLTVRIQAEKEITDMVCLPKREAAFSRRDDKPGRRLGHAQFRQKES
jgi:hypothetical protein